MLYHQTYQLNQIHQLNQSNKPGKPTDENEDDGGILNQEINGIKLIYIILFIIIIVITALYFVARPSRSNYDYNDEYDY
jgi:hypothetical protein